MELIHPAAAVVEIECREPVAMVDWQNGVLAVDAEGVVLPSEDFTAEAAAAYPRIVDVGSSPQAAEGFPWGDPAVAEGAAVAAAIGPEWKTLALGELRPVRQREGRRWELVGQERRVIFGSAPGHEAAGEPSAAAKIARLKTLDAAAAQVDLTVPADDALAPRTIPAG